VTAPNLHAKLPIFDAHLGMIAELNRTGEEWDTEKAVDRLLAGAEALIKDSKRAETITIVFGGDTTHQDDKLNRTPGHKHALDGDYYHKVIFTTTVAARDVISMALGKFQKVKVKVLRGNHDENAHVAITVGLAMHYEAEPRVSIDATFDDFFEERHGLNMDLYHHGDKGDPTKLVLKAADFWAEDWCRSKWRNCYTGHIHTDSSKDIGGMKWQSMRTMAPQDFYGHSSGWVSRQSLRLIVDHHDEGEKHRYSVNF
ncbi:MAG: hypothetical protein OIF48_06580, partial [Silicimonas sp.]|nr:hypothetical protein [Silicimonas sp.]